MSDTILSGDFTVYYLDDDRRKQIRWTGTTVKTDVEKMIDVYDACEDLMTQPTQMDDGLIFSAETPGEYTIGKIDAGEIEPWFIDLKTMEHLIGDYANFTGCALKTSGWTRVTNTNVGIVVVPITNTDIDDTDIGDTLSQASGDAGTLLDIVITGGATDYLWIRPTNNTATHDWDTATGQIDMDSSAHLADQSAIAHTGEMVWGNVYTQGALQPDTHVYMYQDGEIVTISDDDDNDWWVDGHVDRAVPITDYTVDTYPILDLGYITVKANQYGTKYTYAIIRMNTSSGGNVSAGLSSGDDITNTTGYSGVTFDGTGFAAGWSVGDEMNGVSSGARGIITLITSPGSTQVVHYYLVGDPIIDFSASESVTNEDDTGTGKIDGTGPEAQGPALATWFDGNVSPEAVTFANIQADINDDTVDEEYGIAIDMNSATLAEMNEWAKYLHRRGSVVDQDGLDGQEWIGIDYAINYSTIAGTVAEGVVVTGKVSGATGTVVSNPGGSANTALLRDSRGTFQDGEAIYENDPGDQFNASGLTVEVIVPVAQSSFGTIAGTSFFGSRGVLLTEYKTSEANSFSLIDATGAARARPTVITMEILNLKQHDWATCYRLIGSGLAIEKDEFTATGGESIGDTTLDTDGTIPADVPGKTLGGSLVLVDADADNKEYVIRYASYAASTGEFTLANSTWVAESSTAPHIIFDTGAFANTKVGDLVYNNDLTAVSYVAEVVSDDQIIIYPELSGQDVGDTGEINCVPIVPTGSDEVYVPIVFEFQESDGSTSAGMQYIAPIYSVVRVRNTSDASQKIKGFTAAVTIGTGGGTSSATRIDNTVYGS